MSVREPVACACMCLHAGMAPNWEFHSLAKDCYPVPPAKKCKLFQKCVAVPESAYINMTKCGV
jgi:hypothetical protein